MHSFTLPSSLYPFLLSSSSDSSLSTEEKLSSSEEKQKTFLTRLETTITDSSTQEYVVVENWRHGNSIMN